MASQPLQSLHVLVVDDDPAVRKSVGALLAAYGCRTSGALDAAQGRRLIDEARPDVVLTDIYMPGNESLEFLQFIERHHPTLPMVVMTGHPEIDTAIAALRLSAVDYVTKPLNPEELFEALSAASRRIAHLSSLVAVHDAIGKLLGSEQPGREVNHLGRLSIREQEVAAEFMGGLRPKEIALKLHLSENTVRNHFKSIYKKLDVNSQVELQGLLGG